jgi:hypothetical protein
MHAARVATGYKELAFDEIAFMYNEEVCAHVRSVSPLSRSLCLVRARNRERLGASY